MIMNDDHWEEVDRLWRAFTRNLTSAVMEMAGYREGNAFGRLVKTWEQLCEFDLDVAGKLYHGFEQIDMQMARNGQPNSPAEHNLRQLSEMVGMATIARDANPDAETETLGELLALADEEVQRQIGTDTGHASD